MAKLKLLVVFGIFSRSVLAVSSGNGKLFAQLIPQLISLRKTAKIERKIGLPWLFR